MIEVFRVYTRHFLIDFYEGSRSLRYEKGFLLQLLPQIKRRDLNLLLYLYFLPLFMV